MDKELVCVCSYCPDAEEITKEVMRHGDQVTHGICKECFDIQMEIVNSTDTILYKEK